MFCPRTSFQLHVPHNVRCSLYLGVRLDVLATIPVILIIGFRVWPCRSVWKFRRCHFCRFQDADGSEKGLVDSRHISKLIAS